MGRVRRHVGKFLEPPPPPFPPPAAGTPGGDRHRHVGHPRALVLAALESPRLPFAIHSSLDRTGPPAELGFGDTGDARRQARVSGSPRPGLVALFLATSVALGLGRGLGCA